VGLERRERVLEDRPPGDLDQLLGDVEPDPGADASGEEDGDVRHGASSGAVRGERGVLAVADRVETHC